MFSRASIRPMVGNDEYRSFLAEFVIPVAFGALMGVALGLSGIALLVLRLRVIGW